MPTAVFLCVANSARSQMAEGLARASAPPGWTVHSAGSQPTAVNPLAVDAMAELGIDISGHRSKGLDDVPLADADLVVTLCAEEQCPVVVTAGRRLGWPLQDPADPGLGNAERRDAFRRVRDEIGSRLARLWTEWPASG